MKQRQIQQHPNFRTALRNEQFYETLLSGDIRYHYWEWMLTALFYAALHYMKSYLSIIHNLPKKRIDSHRGIITELSRLKKNGTIPKFIFEKYEQFKNDSELARYHYLENFPDFNHHKFKEFVKNSYHEKFELIRQFALSQLEKE